MATHAASDTLPKPTLVFCKKCNDDHKKPVGNKWEKDRNVSKEEKRDSSHEITTVKKIPKGKTLDSQDKMLYVMMNTINSVTEKLAAMGEHISGLTSRMGTPPVKMTTRKSRSRKQTKRRGVSESDEALFGSPLTNHALIQDRWTWYSQVFSDTVVALKPTPTPVRAKKQKLTIELGCTPLTHTTTSRVTSTITSYTASQPVTETVAQLQGVNIQM